MISPPSHQSKIFYIQKIQKKMFCRPQSNSRMCMLLHLAIRVGYKNWIEQSGNIGISILHVESTIQRNTESALRIWHIEFCCLRLLSISCFTLVQWWEKVIDLYTDHCDFISDIIAFANYLHNDTLHYSPFRELAARGTSTNQIAASGMLQATWLATVASRHIVRQTLLISL